MTAEKADLIGRMWRDGVSCKRIAATVGLKRSTVYNYASAHRDRCPARGRVGWDVGELRRMWAEGASVCRIAREIGADACSVSNYVAAHRDECPRRRHPSTEEERERMRELRRQGMSLDEVAEIMGCSARTVLRHTRGSDG